MVKEIEAKSMLHYHDSKFATNWDANIYRGCAHNCVYCFAQYSHKYLGTDNFFGDVFAKVNAAEVLLREFRKKSWCRYPVNLCGVSDCYQPVEADCQIMPNVIKSFITHRNPLVICTKSTLMLRDIEMISMLSKLTEVSIAVSVSTLDEDKRRLIEPNAAPTMERLDMLNEFKKIGCHTTVLFMPVIPYISDDEHNLDRVFEIVKRYDFDSINVWQLHLRGNTKRAFLSFLSEHFSELLPKYKELYKYGEVSDEYRNWLMKKIKELRDKYEFYKSYKTITHKTMNNEQLSLFD